MADSGQSGWRYLPSILRPVRRFASTPVRQQEKVSSRAVGEWSKSVTGYSWKQHNERPRDSCLAALGVLAQQPEQACGLKADIAVGVERLGLGQCLPCLFCLPRLRGDEAEA